MAIQDDLAKADKSKSKKQLDPLYGRKMPGVTSSAPKKAVDKSGYNMKIKVSQAQIDAVKKLGMAGAIKSASAMSPAMREAATRLYGAKRIGAASASKPAAKSGNSSNYGNGAGKPAMTKPATVMAKPKPKADTSKVISTGGRGVTGQGNMSRASSSNSVQPKPRKPSIISTGGRGVTGQGTLPRSTSKSSKKVPNRMDTLFGKKK
jgi:hypothetical protein